MSSIFDKDFTNLYELSKTLRFELKPIGNTSQMLKDNQVFEKDEQIENAYQEIKPLFDDLHRKFVKEALKPENVQTLEFAEYAKMLVDWDKIPSKERSQKQSSELDVIRKKLYKQIADFLNAQGEEWKEKYSDIKYIDNSGKEKEIKLKSKGYKILTDEGILQILKHFYPENSGAISCFDKFYTYFTGFNQSRENFYKEDGTASAIPTRIVENLDKFIRNRQIYLDHYRKIGDEIGLSEEEMEIFHLEHYYTCFLQEGIEKYNSVIGGKFDIDRNINEKINEYRQISGKKIPYLNKLHKQILGEQDKILILEIEDDKDLLQKTLPEFVTENDKRNKIAEELTKNFFNEISKYALDKVYLSNRSINTISNKFFVNWEVFKKLLVEEIGEKEKDRSVLPDFICFADIKLVLDKSEEKTENVFKDEYKALWVDGLFQTFLSILAEEFESLFEEYRNAKRTLINDSVWKADQINEKEREKKNEIIKQYADANLNINGMMRYFALEKKRESVASDYEIDAEFYNAFDEYYTENDSYIYYNALRNYLTKKPYETGKIKLNFENSTLAGGWDKNKEKDNFCVILRKNGNYYLGIMKKGAHSMFVEHAESNASNKEDVYEKVVYKYFPDPSRMFPKVCFSKKGLEFFNPPANVIKIYKEGSFKKGSSDFSIENMQTLIAFYKNALTQYSGWQCYKFNRLKPTSAYTENIGEFYNDVAPDGYNISFHSIAEEWINAKNEKGDLYLFQIYNKDFSPKKTTGTTENLHTMYFKELFSERNLADVVFKLNGGAEIFFRPRTEIEKLGTRSDSKGNDVIKARRYAEDKYFFHLPISINWMKENPKYYGRKLNQSILELICDNPDINIIGIDRGEKHLAYYSAINQKGKIIKIDTLNSIRHVNYGEKINYHERLDIEEDRRDEARKSWKEIGKIKDLKDGYISGVVRELADLIIEHNAIIIFEDLNSGFKRGRMKIEKQVYQKLEKALIEKLNFLVDKGEKDPTKAGHLLRAYQLTAPFTTFKDMGKQTGIIFYTAAGYTSTTDPVTGWRKNIYLSSGSIEKNKETICRFKQIVFNKEKARFEFTYDIKDFNEWKEFPKKTKWTVCSCVERLRWNNRIKAVDRYSDVTENLIELIDGKINYRDGENICDQIKDSKFSKDFYGNLIFYINLIMQIRNSDSSIHGDDGDFIQSPVADEDGIFFDSRNIPDIFDQRYIGEGKMHFNGDANGAYNTARKGILLLQKISDYKKEHGDVEKFGWKELYVSNVDWDDYAQMN